MKIMVLSSHTQSLFWFRFDMMKAFQRAGHKVIAVANEPEELWIRRFQEHSINYKRIPIKRNGLNPFYDIITLFKAYCLIKKEKPDKLFCYQAKTIIYGSIAGKLNSIPEIYTLIAGLGSIVNGNSIIASILKKIILFQYKIALNFNKRVFFQNRDDLDFFINRGIVLNEKCVIINGSGVNMDYFNIVPFPNKFGFLLIARLIKDKGIIEYLEASRIIKMKFPAVRCMLVGPFDTNPTAIKRKTLEPYIKDGTIEYFGEQEDVRSFISLCNVYVLPSYYEGTPKTILEAMAMGRPIITTAVPGCKETVIDGKNGFLIPPKDVNVLVEKMEWFILNQEKIEEMGIQSFNICKAKFDVKKVNEDIIKLMKL